MALLLKWIKKLIIMINTECIVGEELLRPLAGGRGGVGDRTYWMEVTWVCLGQPSYVCDAITAEV